MNISVLIRFGPGISNLVKIKFMTRRRKSFFVIATNIIATLPLASCNLDTGQIDRIDRIDGTCISFA